MIIETKYEIGYEFWVPRTRKIYKEEKMVLDGVEWSRETVELVPYAKKKVIVQINATVTSKGPHVKYCVLNSPDTDAGFSQTYSEHQITDYDEETALKIAKDLGEAVYVEYEDVSGKS